MLSQKEKTGIGKLISLVLRHDPGVLGITLDKQGWAEVDELLRALRQKKNIGIDRAMLENIAESSEKKRYAFSEDGAFIRAVHGHSLPVDLGYEEQIPSGFLFHGTAKKNLDAIRIQGLERRARQFVHLSEDEATAKLTGMRHGSPVILTIKTGEMHLAGHEFFHSSSNVWLTGEVPAAFIIFPTQETDS
ncbi:MAG: putative RNA 2'-phosphotransferase [Bacteroidetes bacterium]|nr:MAG: putative RNA 2'-phosphotransferase [Bacteroidota bacterium]